MVDIRPPYIIIDKSPEGAWERSVLQGIFSKSQATMDAIRSLYAMQTEQRKTDWFKPFVVTITTMAGENARSVGYKMTFKCDPPVWKTPGRPSLHEAADYLYDFAVSLGAVVVSRPMTSDSSEGRCLVRGKRGYYWEHLSLAMWHAEDKAGGQR